MRDLDLTTLRLFVAVCDERNMARAAAQHHVVGSAVSKRLAQLEQDVGTPLLVRRRRGVEPTAAGESLLEHARALLDTAQRAAQDMAAFAQGVRGQVRILASPSALAESLADDVAAFLNQSAHADIQVHMEERSSAEIVRGIQGGLASLGVCWDAAPLGELRQRAYRSDHLAVVVHPTHALAQRSSLRFEDTLDSPHVSLPMDSAVQILLQRAAAVLGKTIHYRVVVSSFEATLRVVRAGLAISVVPQEVAQPYESSYGLRVIPLTDDWAVRRFVLCFRSEEGLSPAARLLLGHLAACGGS